MNKSLDKKHKSATAAFLVLTIALVPGELLCAGAEPEVHFVAPSRAAGKQEFVETIVAKAAGELRTRFGLSLPPQIIVELTGREGLSRIASSGRDIRYDGVALAYKNTVAVDIESGSAINLLTVLRHELFHIASAPANLPRWFDEGMAMIFSGDLFPLGGKQAEMRRAPVTDVTPPASSLDLLFASRDGKKIHRAYADSYMLVSRIVETVGDKELKRLFSMRLKTPDEAFEMHLRAVTGINVDALYRSMDKERNPGGIRRFIRVFTGISPFAYLAALLVIGGIIKRKRLKELLSRMEDGDAF